MSGSCGRIATLVGTACIGIIPPGGGGWMNGGAGTSVSGNTASVVICLCFTPSTSLPPASATT